MKKVFFILSGIGISILLVTAWFTAINAKSVAEKQLTLIEQADIMINNGIYIRAVALLEEASGYDSVHTITAENNLKNVYLALIDNRGFSRKYTALLEKQMNRKNAESDVFMEAAGYYLKNSKIPEALSVLRNGIERTGDPELIALYEKSRYSYEIHRTAYEDVTAIFGQTVQVRLDGMWGIANADGTLLIPCEYEKIGTFYKDRAVVMKNDKIYAVDRDNNRIAVPPANIIDFGNYGNDRILLYNGGGWIRASGEFELGTTVFDDIRMYSGGYAAAKSKGKWGVTDINDGWLVAAEYDAVITDELGRCYAQGAVFVRSGISVYLIVDGERTGSVYEDAQPFGDEGYAAVKKNGYWGFIDNNGNEMIPFVYDEALSFGQHLAAVKYEGSWGYINIYGHIVIEPIFLEAKSFSAGSAPVLTQRGWQFITLLEMKKGAIL